MRAGIRLSLIYVENMGFQEFWKIKTQVNEMLIVMGFSNIRMADHEKHPLKQ